ncbi:hypothetical protein [Kribbella sp. NPDC023855]|uniref:hypothetical protein n=1 Tax=Kribbella sp. NPDC023855 TaxID=3154698 RepID=UPI0033D04CC3
MLHASTIGGYVLEEVLAKLLADNGYSLLTTDAQDPANLLRDKHGLLVRGRGTNHQADALGDLLVPVPFSLPIRLFAEAKNRAAKTGLEAVRNAVGVVSDVNQFQPPPAKLKLWRGDSTYHYRYSLFSTSGFTAPAQEFAIAHQISLIDLSGPSFALLRKEVELFASAVQALAIRQGLETFPVGQMRASLRMALGTLDDETVQPDPSTGELTEMSWSELRVLADELAAAIDDDLVFGFPVGAQVLALKPDNAQVFRNWAEHASGVVPMRLRYAPGRPHGEWVLVPQSELTVQRIVLRFGTPPALAEWLFTSEAETGRRLNAMKRGLLSTITIYQNGRRVVLELDLDWSRDSVPGGAVLPRLQEELVDHDLAWKPDDEALAGSRAWSSGAARRFVDLLRQRDPARHDVLLYAASHDDWVSRAHVYELMDFDPERKLTSFTKPFDSVLRTLVEEQLLSAAVTNPIVARYDGGTWALGFDLDPDLGRTLRTKLPYLLGPEDSVG